MEKHFFRTFGPNFNKTLHKAYLDKGGSTLINTDYSILNKMMSFVSLNQCFIRKCVYWLIGTFSLVSDLAHGPLLDIAMHIFNSCFHWFLANLSQRLKCAFLITIYTLSVIAVVVNFSHFFFFSKTTVPNSTKFGTKHHWVREVQVFTNEGLPLLLRGDIT